MGQPFLCLRTHLPPCPLLDPGTGNQETFTVSLSPEGLPSLGFEWKGIFVTPVTSGSKARSGVTTLFGDGERWGPLLRSARVISHPRGS